MSSNSTTSGCLMLTSGTSYSTVGSNSMYLNGTLTLNNNSSSMNQQARVAVFKVARNKDNTIKSSTFINEFWIEKKPGVSIDFAVAKLLKGEYEADEIIIKEIYTVTL